MTTSDSPKAPADAGSAGRGFPLVVIALVVIGLGLLAVFVSGRGGDEVVVSDGAESGTVEVVGTELSTLPREVRISDASTDPEFGTVAPTITGTNFDGSEVVIEPDGAAKAIYFVAHWCPHCQAEVPMVQELIDAGKQPDGLEIYAISTAVDAGGANFPPSAWLEREGFTSQVLRDDDASTAIAAFGGSSFPFVVYLDADHKVVARSAGSLDAETTEQLWQTAVS